MKTKALFLIIFVCYNLCISAQKNDSRLGFAKPIQKELKDFVFIDSGTFTKGSPNLLLTPHDTTFLVCNFESGQHCNSFFMSNHEVTNKEYREFVQWVIDSCALSVLASFDDAYYIDKQKKTLDWSKRPLITIPSNQHKIDSVFNKVSIYYFGKKLDTSKHIYTFFIDKDLVSLNVWPDILIWINEMSGLNYGSWGYYFSDIEFEEYPVVGVTWLQAQAYCAWKTERLKEQIDKSNNRTTQIIVRLPNETEWEIAAYGYKTIHFNENIDNKLSYPWPGYGLINKTDEKGRYEYLANFGRIDDQNGITLKLARDDGFYYTSKTKSFPSNGCGLYDMAGNVAEWVQDSPAKRGLYEEFEKEGYPSRKYYRGNVFDGNKSFPNFPNLGDSVVKYPEKYKITRDDSWEAAVEKVKSLYVLDSSLYQVHYSDWGGTKFEENNLYKRASQELHDAILLSSSPHLKTIKGGSWANGPSYMLVSSREVMPYDQRSCKVGFRVAMQIIRR